MCKRLIIFVALLASSCLAEIKPSEYKESRLVEAVVQILESCYTNRINAVGLAGNSTGMISEALWCQGSSPITLIDATARKTSNDPVRPQSRYRLQVFVITASSSMDLTTTLNEIKTTIWWNHMAAFLVLDWQLSHQGCNNAFEMLWTTWEMNLLNANFLCYHWTKGRLIYTFNPYTNWAPDPWKLVKSYRGKNDHPWTLFVRRYEEDAEKISNNFDFEKANNLGGYQIRVSSTIYGHDRDKSDSICPGVFEDISCKILFPALNATANVLVHDSLSSLGFVDGKGNTYGILKEVLHGVSDIGLLPRYSEIFIKLPMLPPSYPHFSTDLISMTQYNGYKSQLSKIQSVIDRNSRLGLILVCIITVIFFKYVVRQSVPVAHLNTIRIICNSSLPKISGELGTRIYLGGLFLFALTMQGIYQGRLASLLTKQEPLRNVNSMKDLAELGHTIYGPPACRFYFTDPVFEGRYVSVKSGICTDYVLRNPNAACIGTPLALCRDAAENRLHLSRNILTQIYMSYPIRPDWPLEQRVNTLVGRAIEAYLWVPKLKIIDFHTDYVLVNQANAYENQAVKTLTLEQLGFAFAILGIGLGIATASFIIEVVRGWLVYKVEFIGHAILHEIVHGK